MGLYSRIIGAAEGFAFPGRRPAATGVVSPYQSSQLSQVVWAEHFQGEGGEVTRNSAMQIGAVSRARGILTTAVSSLPLRQFDGESEVDAPWLYRTNGVISPFHRMLWTVDDHYFYGWSLWAVDRDSDGQITNAGRVEYARWSYDEWTGQVSIDGFAVRSEDVILIPGGNDGLLANAAPAIRQTHALWRSRAMRAQNPMPLIHGHPIDAEVELTDEEFEGMGDALNAALAKTNAAIITDGKWKLEEFGSRQSFDMHESALNDMVLEFSRHSGIAAALLDGSQSTASLTYSTQEGKRNEFIDFSLQNWTAPIEARLSMDDVCPPGQRIRFDKAALTVTTNPPIAGPTED